MRASQSRRVGRGVALIGGGQAALATAFYLRRAGLTPGEDFVLLVPGWIMPAWNDAEPGYPPRDHVVAYLTAYERRYDVAVLRPPPGGDGDADRRRPERPAGQRSVSSP